VVVLALLSAACTPLNGQSASVEVDEPRADAVVRAEEPGQRSTTSTSAVGPWRSSEPTTDPVDGPGDVAPAERATPPTTAPTTTASPPTTTSTTAVAALAPPPDPVASPAPVTPAPPSDVPGVVVAAGAGSHELVAAALALLRFDWAGRLPGWELRFHDARRGVRGLTHPDQRVIEIFLRKGDSPQRVAHVVAHELGHAVDLTLLSALERDLWRQGRGYGPGTVWYPSADGQSDFATGAGDFAEAFAWLHGPGGQWSGELGPPPTGAQAVLMAVLIDSST
jgi:hypothetical protein